MTNFVKFFRTISILSYFLPEDCWEKDSKNYFVFRSLWIASQHITYQTTATTYLHFQKFLTKKLLFERYQLYLYTNIFRLYCSNNKMASREKIYFEYVLTTNVKNLKTNKHNNKQTIPLKRYLITRFYSFAGHFRYGHVIDLISVQNVLTRSNQNYNKHLKCLFAVV